MQTPRRYTTPAQVGLAREVLPLLLGFSLGSCEPSARQQEAPVSLAAPPNPTHAASASGTVPAAPQLTIPTGAFTSGTMPGSFPRRPEVEPKESVIKLGEFRIDRAAFPNEDGQPPTLGLTRDRASALCEERSGRLCTELEWERACRGPKSTPFAGGNEYNCTSGACLSGFGVAGLGALPEWTASDFGDGSPFASRPVIRGAPPEAPIEEHRCAGRATNDGDIPKAVAFRCCYGAPNAAHVAEPQLGPAFQRRSVTGAEVKAWLSQDPVTQPLAERLVLFSSPDSVLTVLGRGPGDRQGFDFTVDALLWQPVAGAEYLVLAGRSGDDTSFVLAFHALGLDRYRLASSFIMQKEKGPVVLAYSESIRPRLHFSSCWGCPGETGKVLFRPPDRAVIVQP